MQQPLSSKQPLQFDTGRTFFGHPRGLFLLFGVEMWERFSFYGMKAILILYLTAVTWGRNPGRGWSDSTSSILVGWYGALAYLLPVIGGVIADRLIGTNRSMYLGGFLIAMGHLTLGLTGYWGLESSPFGMTVFIFGLALIVIGTGHFKPSVSVMVGQLYQEHDTRRDAGFSLFYMGINLGAFLGQIICGYLGEKIGWHWGFGAAAVGMLAGLGMYSLGRRSYLKGIGDPPSNRRNIAPLFIPLAFGLAMLFAAMFHYHVLGRANEAVKHFLFANPYIGSGLTAGVVLAVLIAAVWFAMAQRPGERGAVATIFIFTALNAVFWLAFEQSGTSLNLFAADKTNRYVFGWELPASWLLNVNPLLIITLSPVFAWIWAALGRRNMDPSQSIKIALGLIFAGIGFLFMVGAGHFAATGVKVSMFWLVGTYFWHTVGELCLSPTGLSFVTKVAPVRFVSLLMGIWFISSFLALLAGGYIASTVHAIETGEIQTPWRLGGQANFFMLFVISSVGAGILSLILAPVVKKMLHGRE